MSSIKGNPGAVGRRRLKGTALTTPPSTLEKRQEPYRRGGGSTGLQLGGAIKPRKGGTSPSIRSRCTNVRSEKKFGQTKIVGPKKVCVKKNIGPKKLFGREKLA